MKTSHGDQDIASSSRKIEDIDMLCRMKLAQFNFAKIVPKGQKKMIMRSEIQLLDIALSGNSIYSTV